MNFVITGTSKGLGKYLALSYLSEGHSVAGCSRSESTIEHPLYSHHQLDVSSENDVAKMIRKVVSDHKVIDALINNAGRASMNHILTTPSRTADELLRTNFLGTFLMTREVGKQMCRQKKGAIVNFSTVAVPLALEGEAVYASTKSAIETFTKITAKELGHFGVRVNAVGPTPVETDLIRAVPPQKIAEIIDQQAIKRMGEAGDVKNVIDFFISPASQFITGQVLYLGGVA